MTTSTGEHKRSKRRVGDVFKQPTKHLRRGKACLNCRFLKIKCDGVKPTCGQCIRVPKDDPCEYTDGPSRTVLLQQNVAQLQARIRELEQSNLGSSQSETVRNGTSFNDTNSSSPWKALLSTVILWGIHLSDSHIGTPSAREADLLQRALSHTAIPAFSGLKCFQTIQLIQAKVLLATYFLRRNQFMDSDYHISGAVSLCLSLGLHKLNYSGLVSSHSKVPCANSWVDMDERIRGFWTVFALQRHILIVRYPWSNAFGNLNSCQEITTPWPMKMGEHVSVGCSFLLKFLSNCGVNVSSH
ncbi:hypothetical protein L218DRAFT_935965 [Marasmius fiardii PR-910]|nr:hypothetical protein L218DRAFT_935965 [Marasmius fiardii PR-910]